MALVVRSLFFCLILVTAGCASRNPSLYSLDAKSLAPVVWTSEEEVKPVVVRKIRETAESSFHRVRLRGAEKPHIHETHDGVVVLLSGRVRVHLGEKQFEMKPGDILEIARGEGHWAENAAGQPSEAYVVFTPPFDGKDYREV